MVFLSNTMRFFASSSKVSNKDNLSAILENVHYEELNSGVVVSVTDGILTVYGLQNARSGELIYVQPQLYGLA